MGDTLHFTAENDDGRQLWAIDGTSAGAFVAAGHAFGAPTALSADGRADRMFHSNIEPLGYEVAPVVELGCELLATESSRARGPPSRGSRR